MTGKQNEILAGRAATQMIDGLDLKKHGVRNKRKKNRLQRYFASKMKNRTSKNIKDASRITIDTQLLSNRKEELASDDETDNETYRDDSLRSSCGYEIEFNESLRMDHRIEFINCAENTSETDKRNEPASLSWQNSYPIITVESENALFPTLIPWGEKERGMIKNHPPFRLFDIQWACRTHGMQLEQALSLRRHHIKLLNPQVKNMARIGLGSNCDIRDTENRFKGAIMNYLKECDIHFRTAEDKKRRLFDESTLGESMQQSPDFILTDPINLTTIQPVNEDSTITEHGQINWIEAKMFYGASTIPDGTDNDVGKILSTAKKYIKNYGSGAFVFSYGCGSKLRGQLRDLGVSVLDSHPLNLEEVEEHQRGWCANKNGAILP